MEIIILLGALIFTPLIQAEVNIQGSSTILPVIKQSAKIFTKRTGVNVYVRGGGSSIGVSSAIDGKSHIGMVSRELSPKESKRLKTHTIAYDGIAVITNSHNPIKNLSSEQIVGIFSGTLNNWKQLGWENKPIITVHKKDGRATKDLFEGFFNLEGKTYKSGHSIGSNAEAIVFVAGDPWAIGYVSIGSAERAKSIGVNINLVSQNGIAASSENIANESYPLRRPLNLVVTDMQNLEKLMFLKFIKGPIGQEIIKSKRFIPAH